MHKHTLILDLGDVLFHWSTQTLNALPRTHLHSALLSPFWGELERGQTTEDEAIKRIGVELTLAPTTISTALDQCRTTLRVDQQLLEDLKTVKKTMKGRLSVYAMTNISDVDFALLKTTLNDWDLFDGVFTSFEARMRKPELGFYRHILRKTGASPAHTMFVDDKIDNVIAARTFGIKGIVFESGRGLMRTLYNHYFDPVDRGLEYLAKNAGHYKSEVEDGPDFQDAFSQFLIYESTNNSALIQLHDSKTTLQLGNIDPVDKFRNEAKTWNYFISLPVGTTKTFPDDVDTTSCALLAFSPPKTSADAILDAMLANRNDEGLVQTYFDPSRPRVDPVVLINVVRAFYKYGRGREVEQSIDWVRSTLLHRGYVNGTLHYYSAESFLFFISKLVADNQHHAEVKNLRRPLIERLLERTGRQDDSLAVAMRVLACQAVGLSTTVDLEYLKSLQERDGGWEVGWVCRYGRSRKRIGNRGVITAYAVEALEKSRKYGSDELQKGVAAQTKRHHDQGSELSESPIEHEFRQKKRRY